MNVAPARDPSAESGSMEEAGTRSTSVTASTKTPMVVPDTSSTMMRLSSVSSAMPMSRRVQRSTTGITTPRRSITPSTDSGAAGS